MKKNVILILLICAAMLPINGIRAESGIVRYVIAVGANNGGNQREQLRYAVSDAQSFIKILNQMGGVSIDRTTILVEPKKESLKAEIARLSDDIAAAKKNTRRIELIFYYSGHSDEEGLLLGRDTYPYRDLRTSIEKIPADVKIAVLDSCSSGAFTRMKGGKMIAPFINDQSQDMRGYAFMTSSSADEASQESDRIGGSFFTHYLIAGLRGAADTGQDGRITLNEAYQYAYRETLNRTERTAGGPQHPNYNIQMTGTGDVILTDLRAGNAHLIIGENVAGRVYINSGPVLVAEINKQKGTIVSLAVDEGIYTAVNDYDGVLSEMKFTMKKGSDFTLSSSYFKTIERENAQNRGGEPSKLNQIAYSLIPFSSRLFPTKNNEQKEIANFRIYLFGSRCTQLNGLMAGVGLGMIDEDMHGAALSAIGNYTGRDSSFIQAAGVFNYSGRKFKGLQAAGVGNINMGDYRGAQLASVMNVNGGNFSGMQASSAVNINTGEFKGFQTSSGLNITYEDFSGFQATGCLNIAMKKVTGYQLAPINIAAEVKGLQTGIINAAKESRGMQLGIINAAGNGHGVQLGVLNYANDHDGYPIGLISIVRNGETRGLVYGDEAGFMHAGFMHGNKNIYNLIVCGIRNDRHAGSLGFGIGLKKDIRKGFISADVISGNIYIQNISHSDNAFLHNQIRFSGGYALYSRLALIGGVTYNHLYRSSTDIRSSEPYTRSFRTAGSARNLMWPGFYIGIRM